MQNSKENRRKAAISTLCSLFRRLAGVPFTGSRCNNVVAYLECFLWPRAKKWPLVLKYHVSMYVYSCGLATCMLLVRGSKWFETLPASFKQSRLWAMLCFFLSLLWQFHVGFARFLCANSFFHSGNMPCYALINSLKPDFLSDSHYPSICSFFNEHVPHQWISCSMLQPSPVFQRRSTTHAF